MRKSDLSDRLKKEFNILTRFLKEKGAYSAYIRNISNINVRKRKWRNLFEMEYATGTVRNMITAMFVWDKTKEGYRFWQSLHEEFNELMDKYHYDLSKSDKASSEEKRKTRTKRTKVV